MPAKGRAAVGGRDCQDRFLDKATDLEYCQFRKLACRSDATAVRHQVVRWRTAAHRPTVGWAKETQTLYSDVTGLNTASDILLPLSASSITSFPPDILSHAMCYVQFVRKDEQTHKASSVPTVPSIKTDVHTSGGSGDFLAVRPALGLIHYYWESVSFSTATQLPMFSAQSKVKLSQWSLYSAWWCLRKN